MNFASASEPEKEASPSPFAPDAIDFAQWGPTLPSDEIMPMDGAIAQMRTWEKLVFGRVPTPNTGYTILANGTYPFSFVYNGQSSDDLLPSWTYEAKNLDKNRICYTWTDPETGLVVEAEVRHFEKFAALDWVLTFRNSRSEQTPVLSDVRALRTELNLGENGEPIVIDTLHGDECNEMSWLPEEYLLKEGEEKGFSSQGGRPSQGGFPFWNLSRRQVNRHEVNDGLFVAIGWTGEWSSKFARLSGKKGFVEAGQKELATILYPHESIRSPRILVMPWNGRQADSHVLFRRLLMFEYAPKWAGREETSLPQQQEFFGQCFDRYYRKRPGWEKYDAQVEFARRLAQAGCTSYWFDAAWFPKGFPDGVGTWFSDLENFPEGIEALGKSVHELGLKFTLWFEPERVAPGTNIAMNHPVYTLGRPENSRLFNLADPKAEQFLTDVLLSRIRDYGVDIYRNDFNINPFDFWRANDPVSRKGMTEIRYIQALYRMWDTLRKEIPGLWIDNCSSGGRRIDLETISRSIPLWRSDTCCSPNHPEWDQVQSFGLAQYIPLFGSVAWDSSPYTFRSAANPGAILQYNFLDDDYDPAMAQASIREAKVYQKFWYGDFYPLTDLKLGKDSLIAWQLNRADLNAGVVYLFRQSNSPCSAALLNLFAIDMDADYSIRFKYDYSEPQFRVVTGRELRFLHISLAQVGTAMVVEYQKIAPTPED